MLEQGGGMGVGRCGSREEVWEQGGGVGAGRRCESREEVWERRQEGAG